MATTNDHSAHGGGELSLQQLADWLKTPLGDYLLQRELAFFETAIADIFGFHALQIGLPAHDFLRGSRITAPPRSPSTRSSG